MIRNRNEKAKPRPKLPSWPRPSQVLARPGPALRPSRPRPKRNRKRPRREEKGACSMPSKTFRFVKLVYQRQRHWSLCYVSTMPVTLAAWRHSSRPGTVVLVIVVLITSVRAQLFADEGVLNRSKCAASHVVSAWTQRFSQALACESPSQSLSCARPRVFVISAISAPPC